MAVTRTKLFDTIANGAAWDAGVVFNRTNGIPIDKFSVFQTKELADDYAANNPVAYPGQLIAVVPDEGEATSYIILADGTLKEIGAPVDLTGYATTTVTNELQKEIKNYIKDLLVKGSLITYTKGDGTNESFNTTFVGTAAEYEVANKAGSISVGTIVYITDDNTDDNTDSTSTTSVLGQAILGQMILA